MGANAIAEARTFGGWTVDKLELLRLYLVNYRKIAGGGTYIDAFAGGGRVAIKGEKGDRPGSVEIAIRSEAFRRYLVYEKNPAVMARLRRNLELRFKMSVLRRVWRRDGDFNTGVVADLARGALLRGKPCFAFLDPDSTQLPWSTVQALAAHRAGSDDSYKIEMLILFNTEQAFIRMLPREQGPEYISSGTAAALDRVMGGRDAWWDLNDAAFNGSVLTRRYRERLIGLGYKHVSVVPIIDPVSGRRQYFMVHASDHPAAKELIVWGEQAIAKSQGRHALFDVTTLFDSVDPAILDETDE